MNIYDPTHAMRYDAMLIEPPSEDNGSCQVKVYIGRTGTDEGWTIEVSGWNFEIVVRVLNEALSALDQEFNDVFFTPPSPVSPSSPADVATGAEKAEESDDSIPF